MPSHSLSSGWRLVAWVIHVGFNLQWVERCSIRVASRGMEGMDFTGGEAVACCFMRQVTRLGNEERGVKVVLRSRVALGMRTRRRISRSHHVRGRARGKVTRGCRVSVRGSPGRQYMKSRHICYPTIQNFPPRDALDEEIWCDPGQGALGGLCWCLVVADCNHASCNS